MKKFKLSAIIAPILSLGVACNGFVCASKELAEMPEFSECEPIADLENACNSEEDKTLRFLLNELKGVTSDKFPRTVIDFMFICSSEKNADPFLDYLESEVTRLFTEGKTIEAQYMTKVHHIAAEKVIKKFPYSAFGIEKMPEFFRIEPIDDLEDSLGSEEDAFESEEDKTLKFLINELKGVTSSKFPRSVKDFVALCSDEEHSGEFISYLYSESMRLFKENKIEEAGYMQQVYEIALYNALYK